MVHTNNQSFFKCDVYGSDSGDDETDEKESGNKVVYAIYLFFFVTLVPGNKLACLSLRHESYKDVCALQDFLYT